VAVTLADIRTEVRRRADMDGSSFVTDAEVNGYANRAGGALHDILTTVYEDYFMTSASVVLPYVPLVGPPLTETNIYPLPSDFFKMRGLDYQVETSAWTTVPKFNFAERNKWQRMPSRMLDDRFRAYQITGSHLRILPEDQSQGTYRLWYLTSYQALASDGDAVSQWVENQGWWEYIVVDAAIKCLQKEESDVSVLMAERAQLEQRIRGAAIHRDAGRPERIAEIRNDLDDDDYRGGWRR
jgi:hypothetical protein